MGKRTKGIAIGIVIFIVFFGLAAPVQAQTYQVWGQVFDTDGVTPVDGADVTVTDINTGDSLSNTTFGGGYYQVVFGPPVTSLINAGDTLEIVAIYGQCLKNTTTVTATVSPQQVDLILEKDTTPPTIEFIQPTPANNSQITSKYVNVSVYTTDSSGIDNVTVVLIWNETGYTMTEYMYAFTEGKYYSNMTNLTSGKYIYWVEANDTCDNMGVSETRIVTVVTVSGFTIDFVTGYNMISLPRNDTSVATASTLIDKIGAESCTEVSKWNKSTQTWKAYAAGQPPIFDFEIGGGEGCFANIANATTVLFTGKGWESPFTISLVTGYNMIGMPVNDTSVATASTLIDKIGAESCTEVSKWNKSTQTWKAYAAGQPPIFDFDIGGGEGCFLNMANSTEVTFEGEAWRD